MTPLERLHDLYRYRLSWRDPDRPLPRRTPSAPAPAPPPQQPGRRAQTTAERTQLHPKGLSPTCPRCGWSYSPDRGHRCTGR